MKVSHNVEANTILREIMNLKSVLRFTSFRDGTSAAKIVRSLVAANGGMVIYYVLSGGVTGIRITGSEGTEGVFSGFAWMGSKQKRI